MMNRFDGMTASEMRAAIDLDNRVSGAKRAFVNAVVLTGVIGFGFYSLGSKIKDTKLDASDGQKLFQTATSHGPSSAPVAVTLHDGRVAQVTIKSINQNFGAALITTEGAKQTVPSSIRSAALEVTVEPISGFEQRKFPGERMTQCLRVSRDGTLAQINCG